jgi:serine/threonine protein kinase
MPFAIPSLLRLPPDASKDTLAFPGGVVFPPMALLPWGRIGASSEDLWEDGSPARAPLPMSAPALAPPPGRDALLASLVPHYRILRTVGEGAFASVFAAKHRLFRTRVAIKYMDIGSAAVRAAFQRETGAMRALRHPCCLRLRKVKRGAHHARVAVITPLLRTTLSAVLAAECEAAPAARWDGSAKLICLLGIAHAIEHFQSRGMLHRDLKPENILLDGDLRPVIGDFGLATLLGRGEAQVAADATFDCGTPCFMAPELFWPDGGATYGAGVDVYAFGVICYAFFTDVFELDDGRGPYWNAADLQRRVRDGARYRRLREIPEAWWTLISNCWAPAATRWTIREVLRALTRPDRAYSFPRTDHKKVAKFISAMEKVRKTKP